MPSPRLDLREQKTSTKWGGISFGGMEEDDGEVEDHGEGMDCDQ